MIIQELGIFFLISNDSNNRLRLPITWDLLLKMNKEKTKAGLNVSGKIIA